MADQRLWAGSPRVGYPMAVRGEKNCDGCAEHVVDYGFCELKSKAGTAFRILLDLRSVVSEPMRCRRAELENNYQYVDGSFIPPGP